MSVWFIRPTRYKFHKTASHNIFLDNIVHLSSLLQYQDLDCSVRGGRLRIECHESLFWHYSRTPSHPLQSEPSLDPWLRELLSWPCILPAFILSPQASPKNTLHPYWESRRQEKMSPLRDIGPPIHARNIQLLKGSNFMALTSAIACRMDIVIFSSQPLYISHATQYSPICRQMPTKNKFSLCPFAAWHFSHLRFLCL